MAVLNRDEDKTWCEIFAEIGSLKTAGITGTSDLARSFRTTLAPVSLRYRRHITCVQVIKKTKACHNKPLLRYRRR